MRIRYPDLQRQRIRKGMGPNPLNVVLSTDLSLKSRREFFTYPDTEKLIITTRAASQARLRRFKKLAEVVVLPQKKIRPGDVLDILWARGARRVLVEGGGTLNFSFFEADVVDEIYITVTPRILGGGTSPTAVDGKGFLFQSHPHLELVSSRRRGDEVFLTYRVVKR
jgi:2,5-diamino-6-(ribosylamino)-4(3H)-pyrimidinone 5'-phosphate reductase